MSKNFTISSPNEVLALLKIGLESMNETTVDPAPVKTRFRRGMKFSPLAKLIVNEHDIPKRAKQDRDRRMEHNVRRTFIGGGILDVIGEGEHTRIWIGRSEKSLCLATLDQAQMRDVIVKFEQALAGKGDEIRIN